VIVSRNGKPLVRITRLQTGRRPIRFGVLKGRIRIPRDFDAPLPEDVIADFEGR
jgi:antitoxin (DNA-binding transcriptional repressor) of toxin-antitoxin stability system